MSRQITKTMAETAATTMKNKAYKTAIENALGELNAKGEEIVRQYIPAPVIACTNEYSQYISYNSGALISAIKKTSNGYTSRESEIRVELTFKIPTASRLIIVLENDYKTIRKLHDKVKEIERKRDEFGNQVLRALMALKTERAIQKELPEAVKYLEFPEAKRLPMPVLSDLRFVIGNIKEG